MNVPEPTIYVVDDDVAVREALSSLLRANGLRVVTFGSAGDFLSAGAHQALGEGIGCLVLDVQLPDIDGVELQQRLSQTRMPISIVFLTGYGDIPMTVRAIKAGAVGFLTKPIDEDQLLPAILEAIEESRKSYEERASLLELKARFDSLTPREQQVLRRVVAGRLNKQIAGEIGTTETTVKLHRGNMMRKLGIRSVAELVLAVQRIDGSSTYTKVE